MKKIKKTLAVLLFTVIALFSFTITTSATDESNTQDGLVASITSSKDSYKSNEDIELTFKVTNTNDYAVENVSLEAIIPNGLTLKNEADTKIDTVSLPAEDSLELSLVVVKGGTVATTPTQKDTTTSTTSIGKSADNTVSTGDNVSYITVGLICLLCLVVIIIAFKFKKKTVKYLSIVLCLCISVGSVTIVGISKASAEETVQENCFEVSKTVKVENNEYEVKENVSYVKISANSNDEFVPSKDADVYVDDNLYTTIPDKNHVISNEDSKGVRILNNQLKIYTNSNINKSKINELISSDNGKIVGYNAYVNSYLIEFENDYSFTELKKVKEKYEKSSYVDSVSYNSVLPTPSECSYYPISDNENDLWKDDWNETPSGANWGIEAINTPKSWEYIDLMQDVNVGVFDAGFDLSHEDLKDNISNSLTHIDNTNINHGTHVTGIIGADFNNNIGIYGISPTAKFSLVDTSASISLSNLYSTDLYSFAYTYLIGECNCKVVNMSLNIGSDLIIYGASQGNETAQAVINDAAEELSKTLHKLLENNKNFVICVGAGNTNNLAFVKDNDFIDTENNLDENYGYRFVDLSENPLYDFISWESNNSYAFWTSPLTAIQDSDLKDRIIVVGAIKNTTSGYELCDFSNIGDRVDVVAPGYDIESTISYNNYDLMDGTSMASPHVAGIAAMLYSLNPDIKGDEVKRIICDTATTEVDGYKLVDAEKAVKKVLGQGTLSATVVCSDNTPLSDVRVDAYLKLKSGEQFVGNTYTDNSGNFSMDLQGGSYQIRLNKDGYKTTTLTPTISKNQIFAILDPVVMEKLSDDNDDAFEYNGHHYKIYDNVCTTWEDAQNYCENLGGHLATITSIGENEALYTYMKDCGYETAYFGFSDKDNEGDWKWVTGESVDYTNWASGEPNNSGKENYAEFYYRFTDGTWNDGNFGKGTQSDKCTFICEWDN